MCRKLCVLLTLTLILGVASTSYGLIVGNFEDAGLDGWWSNDGTLSQSATGATLDASAMQATTTLESTPPERNAPRGTSAISRRSTAARTSLRTADFHSSGLRCCLRR